MVILFLCPTAAGSPVITSFQGNVRVLDDQEDDIKVPIGTKVTTVTKKRLELICPFEGDADSKVVWQVDDQPIVYNNRIKKSKNDSLIIEEIEYYDAGTYSCRVYNRAGKDIMRTHLQISCKSSLMLYFF